MTAASVTQTSELELVKAERDRAQKACEQMGARITALELALKSAAARIKHWQSDFDCKLIPTEGSLQAAAHEISMALLRIKTEHVNPPIPVRTSDWSATLDDYEPGCPIGWGRTEAEAIADLKAQIEDED